ncbi:hypothetical protein ACFWFF_30290, partial [Streptomyces sp. NPDC060223]
MSPRAGSTGPHTLAFVESPVQLLNVLEWAHAHALRSEQDSAPAPGGAPAGGSPGPPRPGGLLVVHSTHHPQTSRPVRPIADL